MWVGRGRRDGRGHHSPGAPGAPGVGGRTHERKRAAAIRSLSLAEQAYRNAADAPPPDNEVWGYAHYKLAYVFREQGEPVEALDELKRVARFGKKFPSLPGAEKLRAAALHDIPSVHALAGNPRKAFDLFQTIAGDAAQALTMSVALGEIYLDSGHAHQGIELDLDLLRRTSGQASCAPLAQLDRAMDGIGPLDAATRAELGKNKQRDDQIRASCPIPAPKGPPGAIHKCAPGEPCGRR